MKEKKLVPKKRFKEFQNTDAWEELVLSNIIKLFGGYTFKSSDSNSSGVPWLKIANVGKDGVDWKITSYLPDNFWFKYEDFRLFPGDYVMALTRPILNHKLKISIMDKKALLNQRVAKVIFETNDEYGFQFLQRESVVDRINNELTGTDPPNLGSKHLKNITVITTPVREEQIKLGLFFKGFDDTIAIHQRKLEKTKALKSAYLAEMFPTEGERVPKRRFAGFTGEWEHRKFDEEIELYSGLTYSPKDIKEKGTFVLRSSNVKNGEIVDADNVYVNSEVVNSSNVRKGDIIVVVRNGSRSLIGKHAQIKVEMCGTVIGAFMTGIRSRQPGFINALLDTKEFKKEVDKNLGATINQITNGMFRNMIFLFPEIQEQQAIGEFFKKLDESITNQQQKLDKLKAMKQAYLQEMFV